MDVIRVSLFLLFYSQVRGLHGPPDRIGEPGSRKGCHYMSAYHIMRTGHSLPPRQDAARVAPRGVNFRGAGVSLPGCCPPMDWSLSGGRQWVSPTGLFLRARRLRRRAKREKEVFRGHPVTCPPGRVPRKGAAAPLNPAFYIKVVGPVRPSARASSLRWGAFDRR
jgi:hypothetical protein